MSYWQAMKYLHSLPYINSHRFLNSRNCIVNEQWQLKIVHIDMAQGYLQANKSNKTPISLTSCTKLDQLYLAPEVLRQEPNIDFQKGDVYSFAMILFELITEQVPFENYILGRSLAEIIFQIKNQSSSCNWLRPNITNIAFEYQNWVPIMEKCWSESPEQRMSFRSIDQSLQTHHIRFAVTCPNCFL